MPALFACLTATPCASDQCNDGFYGLECTQRCPSVTTAPCSGHGVCDSGIYGSGTCTCDVGYTGADCNVGGCVPGSGYVVPEGECSAPVAPWCVCRVCVCPHVRCGGMAGSSVGTCELCEAGRYKSLSLNAPCIECPAGSCRVCVPHSTVQQHLTVRDVMRWQASTPTPLVPHTVMIARRALSRGWLAARLASPAPWEPPPTPPDKRAATSAQPAPTAPAQAAWLATRVL